MLFEVFFDIKVNLFLGIFWVFDLKIYLFWGILELKDYFEVFFDMYVYFIVFVDFNSFVIYVDYYLLIDSWDGFSYFIVDVFLKLLILMFIFGVLLVVWVVLLYINLEYKIICYYYKIFYIVMKVIN